jgi:hypothetical protein
MRTRIMNVELKTGLNDNGRVDRPRRLSKSGNRSRADAEQVLSGS